MVYMTHTGIEVIGQAGGSVAPRCSGVVKVVVAFLLEPYICLQVFFMPFSHRNANILVFGAGRLSHFVYYAGLFFFLLLFFFPKRHTCKGRGRVQETGAAFCLV